MKVVKCDDTNRHLAYQLVFGDRLGPDLPNIGLFVVDEKEFIIAMGFIRIIEGGYGLVEDYFSNPKYSPDIRHEALDLLTEELIQISQEHSLKGLILHTIDPTIIRRATKHGFKIKSDVVMTLGG